MRSDPIHPFQGVVSTRLGLLFYYDYLRGNPTNCVPQLVVVEHRESQQGLIVVVLLKFICFVYKKLNLAFCQIPSPPPAGIAISSRYNLKLFRTFYSFKIAFHYAIFRNF